MAALLDSYTDYILPACAYAMSALLVWAANVVPWYGSTTNTQTRKALRMLNPAHMRNVLVKS